VNATGTPPELGSRALFPDLAARSYLNHAGVSPPSLAVQAAVRALLDAYARGGGAAVSETLAVRARLRGKLARLLGAAPQDVALTSGTTHGLLAVALSFPWRAGDRLVLLEGEFPGNTTPWLRAAELFGLAPAWIPAADFGGDAGRGLQRLDDALRAGARLVAASAVQFQTGLRMPIAEMAALCARHGAELCVDAVQAAGVVPLDVAALGADYVAGGAHKWLMGAEGAGFLWVRPERMAALRPALAGWLSHEDPVSFLTEGRAGLLRYDLPLRRRADVFEAGSGASLAFAALDAALDAPLALGVPAVFAHVQRLHDALAPALAARGLEVLRDARPERRSGILAARPPPGLGARALRAALAARGVVVAIPDGLVRFAPHWPNAASEVPLVAEALDAALRSKEIPDAEPSRPR
jgi:selenocysteine lyase/cysteine desulfurase